MIMFGVGFACGVMSLIGLALGYDFVMQERRYKHQTKHLSQFDLLNRAIDLKELREERNLVVNVEPMAGMWEYTIKNTDGVEIARSKSVFSGHQACLRKGIAHANSIINK